MPAPPQQGTYQPTNTPPRSDLGRKPQFAKLLPVAFVVANILGLYIIYTFLHLVPCLINPEAKGRATTEIIVFNLATFMLLVCYIMCIFVHPGTIPDDGRWAYADKTTGTQPATPSLQKRNGQETEGIASGAPSTSLTGAIIAVCAVHASYGWTTIVPGFTTAWVSGTTSTSSFCCSTQPWTATSSCGQCWHQ